MLSERKPLRTSTARKAQNVYIECQRISDLSRSCSHFRIFSVHFHCRNCDADVVDVTDAASALPISILFLYSSVPKCFVYCYNWIALCMERCVCWHFSLFHWVFTFFIVCFLCFITAFLTSSLRILKSLIEKCKKKERKKKKKRRRKEKAQIFL